MIFATGGTAFGDISIRSIPSSLALSKASLKEITPRFEPSSSITRSSGAWIWLFILMCVDNLLLFNIKINYEYNTFIWCLQ